MTLGAKDHGRVSRVLCPPAPAPVSYDPLLGPQKDA